MDTKQLTARETAARQMAEDANEAVQERITTWKREGRLKPDDEPVMALIQGDVIIVHLYYGAVGIILMNTPNRSTLNGV